MASRSSLWAEVVANLALIAVVTVALNAVLVGKVVQGREAELRAAVASDLSRTLALRASFIAASDGPPDPATAAVWQTAFDGADVPDGEPFFAVLVTRDLRPVATAGRWPGPLVDPALRAEELEALRATWLFESTDLRASMTGRRTERSEWQPRASFFSGRVWATASSPVIDPGGDVVGAVRAVSPVGVPVLGPWDRRTLPVLALSAVLGALTVGAFGFFLFRRRILQPIEALADGTRQLAEGHFETRLPGGAHDELGELASRFNDMAEALETYRRENEAQVAELRAINDDLIQAREDLIFAEKMATVGRLAAGVAHEVGNPLASVIGFAELLESDLDLAGDLLPRIRKELDRIHRIIRDLLAYSRPTGLTNTELEPISPVPAIAVQEVVEAAAQLIAAQPRFADVTLHHDLPEELPAVLVPADRLQQVLLNLFVNAAEAMEGRGAIRIRDIAEPDPELITLEIEDEGPGIDPRAGSNIYEPFFTTKDVGSGTGLGLAVSLRLVEKMGGRLRHIRDRRGGACFHLSLPVSDPALGA